jgi:predicted negative regulator of RcsB-dependent stress response
MCVATVLAITGAKNWKLSLYHGLFGALMMLGFDYYSERNVLRDASRKYRESCRLITSVSANLGKPFKLNAK